MIGQQEGRWKQATLCHQEAGSVCSLVPSAGQDGLPGPEMGLQVKAQ